MYSCTPEILYSCTPVVLNSSTPKLMYFCTPELMYSCTQVLRPESNGGVSCPDLHQSRQCEVTCQQEDEDATSRQRPVRLSADKHKSHHALRGLTSSCRLGIFSDYIHLFRRPFRENVKKSCSFHQIQSFQRRP